MNATLIERIQGALNTAEEGDSLVDVARQAHLAELQRKALIEALEQVVEGAVVHNKQEHRITNYSMNLAKKALALP